MTKHKHKCFVCGRKFSSTCMVGTGKFIICLPCLHQSTGRDENLQQQLFLLFSKWDKYRKDWTENGN